MLKEINMLPVSSDFIDSAVAALIVAVVGLLLGHFLFEPLIQLVFGASVFLLLSTLLERQKQHNPDKYPDGFLGFGPRHFDDIGAGFAGLAAFLVVAYFNMYWSVACLTIVMLWIFILAEDDRRSSARPSRRGSFDDR